MNVQQLRTLARQHVERIKQQIEVEYKTLNQHEEAARQHRKNITVLQDDLAEWDSALKEPQSAPGPQKAPKPKQAEVG